MPLSAQRPENVAGALAPKLLPNSDSSRDVPGVVASRNESTSANSATGGISPTKINTGL
jgi:hypothetical protein